MEKQLINQDNNKKEHKHLPKLLRVLLTTLVLVLVTMFVVGYFVNSRTGITDEDVVLIGSNSN